MDVATRFSNARARTGSYRDMDGNAMPDDSGGECTFPSPYLHSTLHSPPQRPLRHITRHSANMFCLHQLNPTSSAANLLALQPIQSLPFESHLCLHLRHVPSPRSTLCLQLLRLRGQFLNELPASPKKVRGGGVR